MPDPSARFAARLLRTRAGADIALRYRLRARPDAATVHGISVRLDGEWATPTLRESIYRNGYEAKEVRSLRETIRPTDRYLEVGAGIGVVTTVACQLIGSDRVFAYEGNPGLVAVAARTANDNGHSPQVVNAILGDDDEPKDFFIEPDFWASSLTPTTTGRRTSVPGRRFQAVLDELRPTYLMIDIEGGEAELLRESLPEYVRAVCVEVHPERIGHQAIQGMLRRLMDDGFVFDLRHSGWAVAYLERDPA